MPQSIFEDGLSQYNNLAAAAIITIPVILIYMFLQRYVVSGLTGGAVKG